MTENSDSNAQPEHLWKKGQSGNPKGKPKGCRHKATRLAEAMIGKDSEKLIGKVIENALAGDSTCLRLCLERIAPPVRERPVSIELPAIQTLADSVTAMGAILDHVASGELTPSEGVAIAGMVETFRRTIETQELEVRISNLEQKAGA
jgi:hypothetical protein